MRYIKFIIILLLLTGNCFSVFGQLEVSGFGHVSGIVSSQEEIPFWMRANTATEFGAFTNISASAGAVGAYNLGEGTLSGGVYLMARDGVEQEFQRRDLYVQYQRKWLKVVAGAKNPDFVMGGLSATNGNYLWSNNARPLPGILVEANEPLRLINGLSLDWGIGHYWFNDDRFVEDVRLHYKRLGLYIRAGAKHSFHLQLQHFAQWAGTSPVFGQLPNDFNAFVDVFFARKAKEVGVDGEIQNAVGNHLGSYLFEYQYNSELGKFRFYHEHPFEDGSGTAFKNFPDGVWGLAWQKEQSDILSMAVYELIDTRDQSIGTTAGRDNYFNNNVYRSGWTYERNIIGIPFMLVNPQQVTPENTQIISNRTLVHHFGLGGTFKGVNWKLKTSYISNYGTYSAPFPEVARRWANFFELHYPTRTYGDFRVIAGADFNNLTDDVYAVGVGYRYVF